MFRPKNEHQDCQLTDLFGSNVSPIQVIAGVSGDVPYEDAVIEFNFILAIPLS